MIPKKHRINKNTKKQNSKSLKFVIRPPLIYKPLVKVPVFNSFKIKLKEVRIDDFQTMIREQKNKPSDMKDSKIQQINKSQNRHNKKLDSIVQTKKQKLKGVEAEIQQINQYNKLNLKQLNLKQLVGELYHENYILDHYYSKFMNSYKEQEQYQFYQKIPSTFDFSNSLFSIVDHRLFAELLVKINSQKYQINNSMDNIPARSQQLQDEQQNQRDFALKQFYKNMYRVQTSKYMQIWESFNQKFARYWMPTHQQIASNPLYFNQMPRI